MKRSIAIALFATVVVFSHCKKDSTSEELNFLAAGGGSTFTYHLVSDSFTTDFTLTATGSETAVSGRTYKIFSSTDSVNRYFAKESHNYYELSALADLGINNIVDLYLKDDAAVNTSWAGTDVSFTLDSFPAIPLTASFNNTIKEKGIARTVNGKTYTNVTHVRQDMNISPLPGNIGGRDRYYAPSVGLIEEVTGIGISITVPVSYSFHYNATQTLTAYEIK